MLNNPLYPVVDNEISRRPTVYLWTTTQYQHSLPHVFEIIVYGLPSCILRVSSYDVYVQQYGITFLLPAEVFAASLRTRARTLAQRGVRGWTHSISHAHRKLHFAFLRYSHSDLTRAG